MEQEILKLWFKSNDYWLERKPISHIEHIIKRIQRTFNTLLPKQLQRRIPSGSACILWDFLTSKLSIHADSKNNMISTGKKKYFNHIEVEINDFTITTNCTFVIVAVTNIVWNPWSSCDEARCFNGPINLRMSGPNPWSNMVSASSSTY